MDPARDPGSHARSVLRRRPHPAPAFASGKQWLRPPRTLRPTRAGWAFFALTFGVGFAALNTGNNLLYLVLALMLAFLVLSGLLSESALRGIQVRRRLPAEAVAERGARVGLEIGNQQRRAAAMAVVVEDRISELGSPDRAAGRTFALRVAPGASELRSYELRPERRGRLTFHGFVVSTRFPFGLFSKALRIEAPASLQIYPAIDPIPAPPRREDPRRGGESRAREIAGQSPLASGLRDYAPGDPRRRVDWRASLRRGSLLVRELESECEDEARVQLRTAGELPGEGFERRVRRAASEIVAHLQAGRRVALRTDEHAFAAGGDASHRARLLGFLAEVAPGRQRPGAA
jgi:uncharacterized protein (DUF58 family)